jgi:hypothetical protein
MILRMLKRYGDQRFIAAPSLRSATHYVPQKDHAVAEPVLVDHVCPSPSNLIDGPLRR